MTQPKSDNYHYLPKLSRRDSLKWMGALAAAVSLPGLVSCSDNTVTSAATQAGHWPKLDLPPILAKGYGKDPDLIMPPTSPWPKTLTPEQLTLVAVLTDLILPGDADSPSATAVGVPDVIDEWVSAPYASQQHDRLTILSALQWLDDEAKMRFTQVFIDLESEQQHDILTDIATINDNTAEQFLKIGEAFARLRSLVLAGYYSSPEGTRLLGFKGNVAIGGDYPGPTEEAMTHITQVIDDLGLTKFTYQA